MNILPKIKRCPVCNALNFIKVNGITYENTFKSLEEWSLKKNCSCRKCCVELGLFYNDDGREKLVWLDFLKCEEVFYKQLIKLHKIKDNNKENEKKYYKILERHQKNK